MRRKAYPFSRRLFVLGGLAAATAAATGCRATPAAPKPVTKPAPTKDIPEPAQIPKFASPLLVPPAMPKAKTVTTKSGKKADYYEIAMRQFDQQVLPDGFHKTTVWGYGALGKDTVFNAPSLTIEAQVGVPVRVKWINELVDDKGDYLPHLLPVDQTLHWANPAMGDESRDMRGTDPTPYTGPVPIIAHLHGAHVGEESDGFPQAWFMPVAKNMPKAYSTQGSAYDKYRDMAKERNGTSWAKGSATFEYPNEQRATTLWYHDHAMGMTRLNVYAGPAGFYMLRGGPDDDVRTRAGEAAVLPGSKADKGSSKAPHEIPIAIQDRTFNADGSLFYPGDRAFFEDLKPDQLKIPFIPTPACDGPSDISPIWNPEFFGKCLIANGKTWPYHETEPRRYRLRFLNGCQARYLLLKFEDGRPFWQIGAEGGFMPAPVKLDQLLISPAERADVIVDFSDLKAGAKVKLLNLGPDEPYGGGEFTPADPATTGQVMEFRMVAGAGADPTTPPEDLVLPARTPLGAPVATRRVSLNELDSSTVKVIEDDTGALVLACADKEAEAFGPREAMLGVVDAKGEGVPVEFQADVTETPKAGSTEIWEIHNFTADAHPIHIHQVMFEVVDRRNRESGKTRGPELWESGPKDTVTVYPEEVTRVKARFDLPGTFVWHCHIIEHEDNEMMRPYRVDA